MPIYKGIQNDICANGRAVVHRGHTAMRYATNHKAKPRPIEEQNQEKRRSRHGVLWNIGHDWQELEEGEPRTETGGHQICNI